jgi:hypothetical protein
MNTADDGGRRVLSSAQTFFVKFISPFLVVPIAAYLLFKAGQTLRAQHDFAPVIFIVVAIILAFAYGIYWSSKLKRIAVDGDAIYISNYSQEVRLPLAAIVGVTENRLLKFHPVTIAFDADTPWGRSIKFMPKIRFFSLTFFSHPVVRELRQMAEAARAGEPAARGSETDRRWG